MQSRSVYAQSMIQFLAGKAIRDLRKGGKRELRNLTEFCRSISSYPYYQQFWRMLEQVIKMPNSRYGRLLCRAAETVDENCLKTMVVNLGYQAFSRGGQRLRELRAAGKAPPRWIQILSEREVQQDALSALQRWGEQGVSVFWIDGLRDAAQLNRPLALADNHRRAVYVVANPPLDCSADQFARAVRSGNICFLPGTDRFAAQAEQLSGGSALFGVCRTYDEIAGFEQERLYLQGCAEQGALLAIYRPNPNLPPDPRSEAIYHSIVQCRLTGSVELLVGDLNRDGEVVQQLLLHQRSFPNPKAAAHRKKKKQF